MRVTWVRPEDLLRHELWQSAAEGRDVSAFAARWAEAGGIVDPPHGGVSEECAELRDLAEELLAEIECLPEVGAEEEPSDWAQIAASLGSRAGTAGLDAAHGSSLASLRSDRRVSTSIPFASPRDPRSTSGLRPDESAAATYDRILGGWTGRAVGCVLGKPVEKIPRAGIEEILRSSGRWPLTRFITAVGVPDDVTQRWPWNKASRPTSMEENIDGMPEDDDINYALMALRALEAHGLDLSPDDVAQGWLLDLPAGRSFTAERVAYRNLLEAVGPPQSARVRNPYREWIGAQIRTDVYGWACLGDPLRAAELAWRDACVSHTRNGLYGAMFVAAMCAVSPVATSIDDVLDAGFSVVPPRSRLLRAITLGRSLAGEEPAVAYETLEREFAGMHWVHVLNNAALVAYALAAGQGDFDRSICLTVMGGWDTDSNGATVGSVAGALVGAGGIDPYWTGPLQNRISSALPGCDGVSFDDLARRTCALWQ